MGRSINDLVELLLSGSSHRMLKLWDIASGRILASITVDSPVLACALSTVRDLIAAVDDESGGVHFFHLNKLRDVES